MEDQFFKEIDDLAIDMLRIDKCFRSVSSWLGRVQECEETMQPPSVTLSVTALVDKWRGYHEVCLSQLAVVRYNTDNTTGFHQALLEISCNGCRSTSDC